MPILDGFDTSKKLRQIYNCKSVIIACTAFDDYKTNKKCKEYSMDGFLSKPIQRDILFLILRALKFQF